MGAVKEMAMPIFEFWRFFCASKIFTNQNVTKICRSYQVLLTEYPSSTSIPFSVTVSKPRWFLCNFNSFVDSFDAFCNKRVNFICCFFQRWIEKLDKLETTFTTALMSVSFSPLKESTSALLHKMIFPLTKPLVHSVYNKLPVASTTRSSARPKVFVVHFYFYVRARLYFKKENSMNVEQITGWRRTEKGEREKKLLNAFIHPKSQQ